MRIKKIISLILALVLFCCTMIPAFADGEQTSMYELGDKIDDFTVTLSDGSEVSLYGLLETKKAVLINLWATWCGPCRQEFPYMQSAYNEMSDDIGVIALSIAADDTDDMIRQYKIDNGLENLPMGIDTVGMSDRFDTSAIPVSIIVDRNGIICFMEAGSIPSTNHFKALFNVYTADDYSEPVILNELPDVEIAAAPDSAELSAALNAEGSDIEFASESGDDNAIYPFLISDDGSYAYASNLEDENTMASVNATVTVNAGDVLSYEYREVGTKYDDRLSVLVNGECVKFHSGNYADWIQDGIRFAEAGEYSISFTFNRSSVLSADIVCALRNVKLLTGDEAAAFVSPSDLLPRALDGHEVSFEVVDADLKPIKFFADGEAAQSGFDIFMVEGDTNVTVKMQIGKDVDAGVSYLTVVKDMLDAEVYMLDSLEHDDESYYLNVDVSNSSTGLSFALNTNMDEEYLDEQQSIVLLCSEEQANTWLLVNLYLVTGILGVEDVTTNELQFEDGTVLATATTSAFDVEADSEEVQSGTHQYIIKYVDEDGAPVSGVITQFCDDATCLVVPSDENGVAMYESETAYPYEVHVLRVPEGYESANTGIVMDENGGEEEVVLTKAE